jgi:hypothetical protein
LVSAIFSIHLPPIHYWYYSYVATRNARASSGDCVSTRYSRRFPFILAAEDIHDSANQSTFAQKTQSRLHQMKKLLPDYYAPSLLYYSNEKKLMIRCFFANCSLRQNRFVFISKPLRKVAHRPHCSIVPGYSQREINRSHGSPTSPMNHVQGVCITPKQRRIWIERRRDYSIPVLVIRMLERMGGFVKIAQS